MGENNQNVNTDEFGNIKYLHSPLISNIRNIYGISSEYKNNLFSMDDGNCVYAVGPRLVVYNPETKAQKSYLATDEGRITSICAISGKTGIIACGIFELNKAHIQIYEYPSMKRRKPLFFKTHQDDPRTSSAVLGGEQFEVCCLALSVDGKHMATLQNSHNESTLCYWSIEKAKLLATTKPSSLSSALINQILIPKEDESKILAFGNGGVIKLYKWVDNQFKGIQIRAEHKNFVCALWLSADKSLIGSEDGSLYVLDGGQITKELQFEPIKSLSYLTEFSKGIICAGSNGQFNVLEHSKTGDEYSVVKTCQLKEDDQTIFECQSLCVTRNEEHVLFSTRDKKTWQITLGAYDSFKDDEIRISSFFPSYHNSPVVDAETSVWKPIIAVLDKKNCIKIWNYLENTCEISKVFPTEVTGLSIHYMGMFLAVSFKDCVQIYSILIDNLQLLHEISIKNIHQIKFSNGGQYYAMAQGNTVLIYDTWTHSQIATLSGHREKISSLEWDPMDYRLITASIDGTIYEWSMVSFTREVEHITKSSGYRFVTNSHIMETLVAISTDNNVQLIDKDGSLIILQNTGDVYTSAIVGKRSSKLFVGCDTGLVKIIDLKDTKKGVISEVTVSSSAVKSVSISIDGRLLIVGCADGSLSSVNVLDNSNVGELQEAIYLDEALISKTDLEEKNSKINDLLAMTEELKLENEYQLHLKEVTYQEKLKALTEIHQMEEASMDRRIEMLRRDMNEENNRFESEKQKIEVWFQNQTKELESLFNERLNIEMEKQDEMAEKFKQSEVKFEREMKKLEENFKATRETKEHQYNVALEERNEIIRKLKDELDQLTKEYDENMKEIEEDSDEVILQLRHKWEMKLKEERENGLQIKAENTMMKKKHASLLVEIEYQQSEIQKLGNEERKLQNIMRTLEKDIQGLKREIQERDEAIQDKEKRIEDLKKKNQELEKFKFVLDYKMRELKHQIEPREQEIEKLITQIKEMDTELEQYHQMNNGLERKASDLKQRVHTAEAEVEKQRREIEVMERARRNFDGDLGDCLSHVYDLKIFKEDLRVLYQRYCHEKPGSADSEKKIIQLEAIKQRKYLEKNLSSLKEKLDKSKERHRQENARIVKENMILISEINEIRKDLKKKQSMVSMPKKVKI